MLYVGKSKEHLHAPSHSTSQHHWLWMAIPSWEHSLCMASITTHSHCLPPIASGNLVSFPALCSNFPMIKLQDWGLHLLLSSILILSPGDNIKQGREPRASAPGWAMTLIRVMLSSSGSGRLFSSAEQPPSSTWLPPSLGPHSHHLLLIYSSYKPGFFEGLERWGHTTK